MLPPTCTGMVLPRCWAVFGFQQTLGLVFFNICLIRPQNLFLRALWISKMVFREVASFWPISHRDLWSQIYEALTLLLMSAQVLLFQSMSSVLELDSWTVLCQLPLLSAYSEYFFFSVSGLCLINIVFKQGAYLSSKYYYYYIIIKYY